jgi:hypothetical protein
MRERSTTRLAPLQKRPPRATRVNRRRLTKINSYGLSEESTLPKPMRFELGLKSESAREFKQKALRLADRRAAHFF